MFRKGEIWKWILDAAIFIALEIAALGMLKHNGAIQDLWISHGIHTFMAHVWGGTENVKQYLLLKKKNDELALLNYRLEQRLREYQMMTGKDYSLDSIPETVGNFRYIPATVAKSGSNKQHNYLIIAKGEKDGVVRKSGVITEKGVVGIIDAVGQHFSYARSFQNPGMVVSARIGKEGPVGSITWDGIHSNMGILRDIPQHIKLEKEDTVYTSGFSSIFPPDIPVGILGDARIENGATYEIKVRLFEDFSTLRYVTLVNNINTDEIIELEEK